MKIQDIQNHFAFFRYL